MTDLITATGLTKQYKQFTLGPLTFHLPAGYIMGLIGPNGAGKTTTLRLLLDMARPTAGRLTLNGLTTASARQAARDDVGVMLAASALPDTWTVKTVDRQLGRLFHHWDSAQFRRLTTQFEVAPNTPYKRLSTGTKSKVNLAIALSHHARLLLLDEPMAGLDPIARAEVRQLLQSYIESGEASILLSSHLVADLAQIADYLLYLIRGQQRFCGETQALVNNYVLVQGGSGELPPVVQAQGLGLRQTSVGFSALLPVAAQAQLPPQLVCTRPSLETVMIDLGKGGVDHA